MSESEVQHSLVPSPSNSTITDNDTTPQPHTAGVILDLRQLDYLPASWDNNLICSICRCPFIDPVSLLCDHTYCQSCLRQALESQESSRKTCPTCRQPTAHSAARPMPRVFVNILNDLSVQCPNCKAGCTIQLRREDVQTHVDSYCNYSMIACVDATCTKTVMRKLANTECTHSAIPCEDCGIKVNEVDMPVSALYSSI